MGGGKGHDKGKGERGKEERLNKAHEKEEGERKKGEMKDIRKGKEN